MAVLPVNETSQTLDVGDEWVLSVRVTDDDGLPINATVAVLVTTPSGTTSSPSAALDDDEPAVYSAKYTVAAAGRYLAVVTVSGAAVGVVPFTAWAASGSTAADMVTLAQVKDYLGDHSWTDAEITDALDAEAAAQRARCRVPAVFPADLKQALKRRVARNLALRPLPLAVLQGDAEAGSTILPGTDPEVRRLEGPFRRRKVG